MDSSPSHSPGRGWITGALAAAVLVTVWWGLTGLGTENFGSDCLFRFGETGPRAERCHRANDRAETWLPRLVAVAWTCAALSPLTPGKSAPWRRAVVGVAVATGAAALVLGAHAMAVSAP